MGRKIPGTSLVNDLLGNENKIPYLKLTIVFNLNFNGQ